MAYRLARAAEEQIEALLFQSARNYGLGTAGKYGELILTVIAALGDDPSPIASAKVPGLAGTYVYPVRMGRNRVERGRRIARPRHLIVYRMGIDGVVEILGLVHDRMVLSRAAQRVVREADQQA